MAKTLTWEPTASEAMELQALIEYFLAEGSNLAGQSRRDQEKIDLLKAETHDIAMQTRTAQNELQSSLAKLAAS